MKLSIAKYYKLNSANRVIRVMFTINTDRIWDWTYQLGENEEGFLVDVLKEQELYDELTFKNGVASNLHIIHNRNSSTPYETDYFEPDYISTIEFEEVHEGYGVTFDEEGFKIIHDFNLIEVAIEDGANRSLIPQALYKNILEKII